MRLHLVIKNGSVQPEHLLQHHLHTQLHTISRIQMKSTDSKQHL